MASYLSPILSSDSANDSVAEEVGKVSRAYEVAPNSNVIDSQEQRRLVLARAASGRSQSNCSDSSSSDQASELDDDERVRQPIARNQAARQSSASLSSRGSSLAAQYLFHYHTHNNHQSKSKFKFIVQSIPLPLVATSIIVVLILCLLLSECKSLQVTQGAAQLPLVMDPSMQPMAEMATGSQEIEQQAERLSQQQQPEQIDSELRLIRLGPQQASQSLDLENPATSSEINSNHNQQHKRQRVSPAAALAATAAERLFHLQQLQLKSKLIGDFIQHRNRMSQSKRHSASAVPGRLRFPQPVEQLAQQQQQQQQLDGLTQGHESLNSMLLGNSGSGGGQAAGIETPVVPASDELISGAAAAGNSRQSDASSYLEAGVVDSRPALLRSSALELDLSEHGLRQHQQQQTLSQQHPRQAYKTTEERAKHNQHLGNNHDRPFDVAQIQCNNTEEGFERFACPTPDFYGRYRCIEDRLFCDGYYDCPGGEDEERVACMYYKLIWH